MENITFQFKCAMFSVATNSPIIALAIIITIGIVIYKVITNKSEHKKSTDK